VVYFHQANKGGYGAAGEYPELFAGELRAAFDLLRDGAAYTANRLSADGARFVRTVSPARYKKENGEIVYVLEGRLEYQVEGKAPVTLEAGEVLFIPAGTIHTAKNVGSGIGAELATYFVEKGRSLVEIAK
jgi:mannose-6-phosphate isomerase-like protein (cupin superfamily)